MLMPTGTERAVERALTCSVAAHERGGLRRSVRRPHSHRPQLALTSMFAGPRPPYSCRTHLLAHRRTISERPEIVAVAATLQCAWHG